MAVEAQTETRTAAPEPGTRHPLGVLFVHGIGEQPVGDTLKSVVDPLVTSLDLWIHGAARCRAMALGADQAAAWATAMPTTHTMAHEQALQMAASAELAFDRLRQPQQQDLATASVWSGSALLADGSMPTGPEHGAPPHAVLHLHTTDQAYRVTEGSALLAESWWARSFVPPTPRALMGWTLKVLPLAVGMHLGDQVRRHASVAFGAGTHGARRLLHGALAVLWLVALAIAVPLALPLQALLTLSVLLGMVPLRFVQDAMRGLQSTLVGTLGDSFLLVSSPVSRAMIVAQCKRDLDWLAARCDRVFVVAHSQGCAVSYLAMCESLPEAVSEVTWIGSGLRKLEVLRTLQRDNVAAIGGWLTATLPFVGYGLLAQLVKGRWTWTDTPYHMLFAVLTALAYLMGIGILVWATRGGATPLRLRLWNERGVRLTELHASHDPVPHGPLFDEGSAEAPLIRSQKVRNNASVLGDHTGYWRNVEEVVLPLALRIAAAVGVPVSSLLAHDPQWHASGVTRRHQRVTALMLLRVLWAAGCAALVWRGWADWASFAGWAAGQAPGLLMGGSDLSALAAPARRLLPDLLLWMGLPLFGLSLGWRLWEEHEQRALLLRKRPSGLYETVLVTLMLSAATVPVAWALERNTAGALIGPFALAFVVAMLYASLGGAEKAFLPVTLRSPKADRDAQPPGG